MAEYLLRIWKQPRQSAVIVLNVARNLPKTWTISGRADWLPGFTGNWRRVLVPHGKQLSEERTFIALTDPHNRDIAAIGDLPFPQQPFTGSLGTRFGLFTEETGKFSLQLIGAPADKKFRIRELVDASWGVEIMREKILFEIQDVQTATSAKYVYSGIGYSLGLPKLPIKKIPFLGTPSLSAPGPWNDFSAPGWLTVKDFSGDAQLLAANVATGTTVSYSRFDFAGGVEGIPGYLVSIPSLKSGRTVGLPSLSGSIAASMELLP